MPENQSSSIVQKPNSKFSPDALRRPQDFEAKAGVEKLIRTVPVRKPDKQWFVQTHPDDAYRLETQVIELKEEREVYVLSPELRIELFDETVGVLLQTSINRRGVVFLWPIKLPNPEGRTNEWNRSSMEATEIARERWVRVQSNMSLGAYECFAAKGELPDPEWPDLTMERILELAFRDRYIEDMGHPVVQDLLGRR